MLLLSLLRQHLLLLLRELLTSIQLLFLIAAEALPVVQQVLIQLLLIPLMVLQEALLLYSIQQLTEAPLRVRLQLSTLQHLPVEQLLVLL
mgnify:FL=1|jgi:hypothetical protein